MVPVAAPAPPRSESSNQVYGWDEIGLDTLLMEHLADAARENGFTRMYSVDSTANVQMHALARRLGLRCQRDPLDASQLIHSLEL